MQISNITSMGTLVSVIGLIWVSKNIHLNKLKSFMLFSLIIKFINMIFLVFLNKTGYIALINILIIIDILTGYIVISSIYPLITTIMKNNTIYSKRKLTEYLFRDIGILVGGIVIGKYLLGVFINYNICLLISVIFLGFSIIVMSDMTAGNLEEDENKQKLSILKYVLKDKILITYSIFLFIGTIGLSISMGLKMLTLTNYFNFSDGGATNYFLIIGLIADIIGILALKYFTPKNDYITITIKFGIRMLAYIIAFLSNNLVITLIAMTWSILISTAYENICDGYYINSVPNEYQLSFTNYRYIVKYLGEAIRNIFMWCNV